MLSSSCSRWRSGSMTASCSCVSRRVAPVFGCENASELFAQQLPRAKQPRPYRGFWNLQHACELACVQPFHAGEHGDLTQIARQPGYELFDELQHLAPGG